MKKNKFSLQAKALLLVFAMSIAIPNMKIYSSVGSYNTSSHNLKANQSYASTQSSEKVAWLGAAAAAIASAYGAGYVLGTLAHHVYDALGGHPAQQVIAFVDYNSLDFSEFDN